MLWLLFFLQISYSAGNDPLYLELGEDHRLTGRFSKLWVEDQQLVRIQVKQNKYFLKTLKPGTTHIRADNLLTKVIISPIGSKKTLADWKILARQFVGIQPAYCGARVCLTGSLYRSQDYLRIISLIKKHGSKLLLALEVDPQLEPELRTLLEQQFRQKGLTPLKVNFNDVWKVFTKNHFENELSELGLQLDYRETATLIGDNIKVAVKVAEITKNFERKLGVHWPDSYQAQFVNNTRLPENSFEIAISAAEKAGEARILASPNLICRSGKEADFFAGGEFPIKVLGLRSKEIQWKRYGIGLKLKPIIDASGQMSLHIETEVSTLDRSITVDDVPALHTNRVSSFFDLIASRTIAISGLIKSEVSENSEGVPFLKNIPVLGALFESKNFQENKSELVIFVTPELMN